MTRPPLDLALVARYAFLVSLTHLIPVPIVDALVSDFLRARLTRLQLSAHGWSPPRRDVRMIGGATAGGCLGLLWSVVSWPFRKLLRYVLWFLLIKAMVDTFSTVVARAVLVDEAFNIDLIPGDAIAARAAMQRASKQVSTRPIERGVSLILKATRSELWRWLQLAKGAMRSTAQRERRGDSPEAHDRDPLSESLETIVQTLARAIWVPEVHEELRAGLRREAADLPRDARDDDSDPSDDDPNPQT